jgi:Ni,Fe-hydrogenase I small subunit
VVVRGSAEGDLPEIPSLIANADGRLELFTLRVAVEAGTGSTNAHAIVAGGHCSTLASVTSAEVAVSWVATWRW